MLEIWINCSPTIQSPLLLHSPPLGNLPELLFSYQTFSWGNTTNKRRTAINFNTKEKKNAALPNSDSHFCICGCYLFFFLSDLVLQMLKLKLKRQPKLFKGWYSCGTTFIKINWFILFTFSSISFSSFSICWDFSWTAVVMAATSFLINAKTRVYFPKKRGSLSIYYICVNCILTLNSDSLSPASGLLFSVLKLFLQPPYQT